MSLTVRELRDRAGAALAEAGVPTPMVDAELLIGHVLGFSRGQVQAKAVIGVSVSADDARAVMATVARRTRREPLQHITGRAPFRSLELAVGPGVFVPRPETEQVAQLAIDALLVSPGERPVAVDLGTGSGAIALTLAGEVPHSLVFGIENSAAAFVWAERNLRETGIGNARLVFGELATALREWEGKVDVVVSNPPYIPLDAVPRDPEVRLFDPPAALYGGVDGLDVVRQVSATAWRLLHPGGTLVLEHGELQGGQIRQLLATGGWRGVSTQVDLLGRERSVTAIR
ncbi:MAG: peptide chain release factor N(5)-glutamine methyltransferase [Microbacteriaceae bacterium]